MTVQRARLRRPRSERGRRLARGIERPPAHWLLLCLFVGMVALLLTEGLTVHTTGASGTPPAAAANQAIALHSKAALWVAGPEGGLVPRQEPIGKCIALTFDDGPDPRWTPEVAATLGRLACRRPSSPSASTSSRTRV